MAKLYDDANRPIQTSDQRIPIKKFPEMKKVYGQFLVDSPDPNLLCDCGCEDFVEVINPTHFRWKKVQVKHHTSLRSLHLRDIHPNPTGTD